jgi:methyltransferase (TIGR00027 family)
MKLQKASRTAEHMAFFRALESVRSDRQRLFEDPFAIHFLRPALRRAVKISRIPVLGALIPWYADRRILGARTSGIARTCLIDELLRHALQAGMRQVVILGAGFDCRGYRMASMHSSILFEVDHPATQTVKLAKLRRLLPLLPEDVHFVPLDFDRGSLSAALGDSGFDSRCPTVFLWEGVTNYLTAESVDSVLRYVSGCAPGSRLIFTYVHRGALDGSGHFADAAELLVALERIGEPWTFGLDPDGLSAYLHTRGLELEQNFGAREYRARYYGPRGRRFKGYHFYQVAAAGVPDGSAQKASSGLYDEAKNNLHRREVA